MKKLMAFILGAIFLNSFLFATMQETCVTRAAIDIGMGGPKLQIAQVDLKTNKIVKMLHTERYFVNFYEDLSQVDDGRLSTEIMRQGLQAFKNAVHTAHTYQADIVALATASFRSASNGFAFANELEQDTGVKIHIIDQSLEGKLAFQAVLSKSTTHPENLVVWDIGGGSIQFVGMTANGSYLIDCEKTGAGAFNDHIIRNLQCRNHKTPNPMSTRDVIQARIHAHTLSQFISQPMLEKLHYPITEVVGVGSVFGYGIATLLGKSTFSLADIETVVDRLPGKTDEDFGGGDYAFCEGSNVILALGFMQQLGIQKLRILNVNNAHGALLYEPFWE